MTDLASRSFEKTTPHAVRSNAPRVLILGGSPFQIPMIRHAKSEGAYVITCDYLPNNPGHALADEYHNVSTTDRDAVLELARGLSIDAVLSFSSEPALQTVAYVASYLGLPGSSLDAVSKLTDKGAFRQALREAALPAPKAVTRTSADSTESALRSMANHAIGFPCIVKPVDSSGSKGITVVHTRDELHVALTRALDHSRSGRCIIEEYIDGDQVHGDGYIQDGNLIFHYLGDHYFYTGSGNRIPFSTRWPSRHTANVIASVVGQVEAIARHVGYRNGPVNIEARVRTNDTPLLIEVSPRNGGNHVPVLTDYLTGFGFLHKTYSASLGFSSSADRISAPPKPGAHYVLHSKTNGTFCGITVEPEIRPFLFYLDTFKIKGDITHEFDGSHSTIGIALLAFDTLEQLTATMNNIEEYIKVDVTTS